MKDGHRLYKDGSMASTKLLIQDPCPLGTGSDPLVGP